MVLVNSMKATSIIMHTTKAGVIHQNDVNQFEPKSWHFIQGISLTDFLKILQDIIFVVFDINFQQLPLCETYTLLFVDVRVVLGKNFLQLHLIIIKEWPQNNRPILRNFNSFHLIPIN